jgi:signal transduction histidine kinase
MTLPVDHVVKQAMHGDRRATDESLRGEREKADELLEARGRVGDLLRESRMAAESQLEEVRADVDTTAETNADVLPELSDKLSEVAESLTQAASTLSAVAGTLKEASEPAPVEPPIAAARPAAHDRGDVVANLTVLAEQLNDAALKATDRAQAADAGEPFADSGATVTGTNSREVVQQLAELAAGMADLTTSLADERDEADGTLRKEREATDRVIEQQLESAEAAIDAHLEGHVRQLERERQITDADLADERKHTDVAVDHVMELLLHEQKARVSTERHAATRNEFLAIVSHDLRAPLSVMSAAAALIAKSTPDGESGQVIRSSTERLRRSVAVMDRLIHDLLDFASFEDGQLKVRSESQDITILLQRAVDVFLPAATVKPLSLKLDVPGAPLPARFDADRMLQVLTNVLQNAIKFTPSHGSVTVHARHVGAECLVAVSDTGIGIPADELESIFERFRQVATNERVGLGLGLYIARWIVEAHGGKIWAESRLGSGSTVYFTLPQP